MGRIASRAMDPLGALKEKGAERPRPPRFYAGVPDFSLDAKPDVRAAAAVARPSP